MTDPAVNPGEPAGDGGVEATAERFPVGVGDALARGAGEGDAVASGDAAIQGAAAPGEGVDTDQPAGSPDMAPPAYGAPSEFEVPADYLPHPVDVPSPDSAPPPDFAAAATLTLPTDDAAAASVPLGQSEAAGPDESDRAEAPDGSPAPELQSAAAAIEATPTFPVSGASVGLRSSDRPGRDRASMVAFLVAGLIGGFFAGVGVALAVLALTGSIRPLNTAAGEAAATVAPATPGVAAAPTVAASAATPSSPVASASPVASESPAATFPPIVAPATGMTPTALAEGQALGSPTAPVTLELWEDYQCPYCARFTQQIEPQLISNYIETGKMRLVYRDFPFLGEESAWASVAARLAQQQGKFWPYHDYLFANQLGENVGSFAVPRLEAIASAIGLDRAAFDAGLQLEAAQQLFAQIQEENSSDATVLGVSSTPTIVLNGTKLAANDYQSIASAIDTLLAGGTLPPASPAASSTPAPSAVPSTVPSPARSPSPGKRSPTPRP